MAYNDTFTRLDANPLDGSWTNGVLSGMKLVSNAAYGSGGSSNRAFWNGGPFADDHYSQCICPIIGDAGLSVRASAGNNYYALYIQGSQLKIEKFVSGGSTLLGSTYSRTNGTTEVFRFEAVGNLLSVYVDGVFLFSRTDESHTSGAAGIHSWGNTSSLDNWEGGDVGGGGSALLKIYNETVNSTSANQRLMAMLRLSNQTQQVSEAIQRASVLRRVLTASVSLAEGLIRLSGLTRIANSAISTGDGLLRLSGLTRIAISTVSLAESALRVSGLKRIVNAAISIGEDSLDFISSVIVKVLSSTVQTAEGVLRRSGLSRVVGSGISIAEGALRSRALARIVNASVSLVEGALRNIALARVIGSALSVGESLGKVSGFVRMVASTVQSVESVPLIRGFVRVVSDSLSVMEGVVKGAVDALGTLSDNLSVIFITIRRGVVSRTKRRGVIS